MQTKPSLLLLLPQLTSNPGSTLLELNFLDILPAWLCLCLLPIRWWGPPWSRSIEHPSSQLEREAVQSCAQRLVHIKAMISHLLYWSYGADGIYSPFKWAARTAITIRHFTAHSCLDARRGTTYTSLPAYVANHSIWR